MVSSSCQISVLKGIRPDVRKKRGILYLCPRKLGHTKLVIHLTIYKRVINSIFKYLLSWGFVFLVTSRTYIMQNCPCGQLPSKQSLSNRRTPTTVNIDQSHDDGITSIGLKIPIDVMLTPPTKRGIFHQMNGATTG